MISILTCWSNPLARVRYSRCRELRWIAGICRSSFSHSISYTHPWQFQSPVIVVHRAFPSPRSRRTRRKMSHGDRVTDRTWVTLPVRTLASATLRLRPPEHVVIRSATPQLSKNVSSLIPSNNNFEKWRISCSPIRMIAAFVLSPILGRSVLFVEPLSMTYFNPSMIPAAMATTFFKAPQISTPGTSSIMLTRNNGVSNTDFHISPAARVLYPIVVSQNFSFATSSAMLAPINTETSQCNSFFIVSDKREIPPSYC